ncbi:MAG TPA: hypothetical protein VMV94_05755 [Phycisphaerae bacterium]|nr:hypothetical protein [Phycisphaerae bacterium]
MDLLQWLENNRRLLIIITAILLALVILQRIYSRVRRMIRSCRPAELNPKLQKYAGWTETDAQADRLAAEKIIATSSTARIAGYDVLRQIEAVFVEGHRSPDEATRALKTAAGRLGANAIINLSQQRTVAGRCAAQGDAVVVQSKSEVAREKP